MARGIQLSPSVILVLLLRITIENVNEIIQGRPRGHAILLASQFSPHLQGTSERRNALLAQIQHCNEDGLLYVQSRIQLRFVMVGSQSEILESSYQCAQKLLHDNIT